MVQFDFSDNGLIHVKAHYDQKEKCQAVPGGKWVARNRAWEYLLTPATASSLLQTFSRELNDMDRQKLQDIADRLVTAQSIKNGAVKLIAPVTNHPPWNHQLVSYNMVVALFGLENMR